MAGGPDALVRVLLADGQPLQRAGFRSVLADRPDVDIVAEAGDGQAAVDLARRLLPDVVMLDVALPRLSGPDATAAIVAARLPVRVLALSGAEDPEQAVAVLRAGAHGYLSKGVSVAELVAAIRTVSLGGAVVPVHLLRTLLEGAAASPSGTAAAAPTLPELTDRERQVLVRMARGDSNAEIAAALAVSATTVKTHVGNVLAKLGVRDRVQAVVRAYETGLVRPRHPGVAHPGQNGARE
ncbi:MAG TPA: response regulator transcription factor [Natronosporangium sp.]|nr:response regulator transcription factor [Natronosporangium sp.]